MTNKPLESHLQLKNKNGFKLKATKLETRPKFLRTFFLPNIVVHSDRVKKILKQHTEP